MLKKLSLTVIAALMTLCQTTNMTAAQRNYGSIYSWNLNINTTLYNSGSISGNSVSITGVTENYKKGTISASSSLRINNFRISIDKSKNEKASVALKYPNGYLNIFCKPKKITLDSQYGIKQTKNATIFTITPDFKIQAPKGSHLEILDGVIHILSNELEEPVKKEKEEPKDTAWYTKIFNKLMYYPRVLFRAVVWKKHEFITIEDGRYEILKPKKIIINNFADGIDLMNEGSLFIDNIRLEIS
ncbi:hypothetical protein ACFLYU_04820 [Candidatus Dependentiae bacterium]